MKPVLTKEERREKRESRRAKQRGQNIFRAEKMHKARLEYEKSPPLLQDKAYPAPKYNIGCSGWFYWHWKGDFYPSQMPMNEWFAHYADNFATVELNAPFYSWPTIATVKSWLRQAGDKKFIYTVKVSELITHTKRFKSVKTLIRDFGLIADLLGGRMGCFLFQLPPSYHYTQGRLKDIITQLDHSRRNVLEFRHASWWNDKVYKAFRETGTIFCSCSGPRLPDELVKTADELYIRFHGPEKWYLHDYNTEELALWVKRIKDSGAVRIWAYFNNDRNGYAIKNAHELLKLLQPRRKIR